MLGVLDVDDGQRHPVEGHRSLDGDVAGDFLRQTDAQEVPVLAVAAVEDLGGGIDVPLNDVPAEPVGGAQGALEVDRVSGRLGAQGGARESLRHEVGGEGTPVHGGDRQAAPVDADGVAQARVLGDGGRLDRQPGAVLDGLEPDDASELLDDSGEHQ